MCRSLPMLVTACLLALQVVVVIAAPPQLDHQVPLLSDIHEIHHGSSQDDIDLDGVGVGFHLGSTYATVALSYPNGTVFDIEKISAGDGWRDMMVRLSLDENQHPHFPYRSPKEYWTDRLRQLLRKTRKLLGFPASWECGQIVERLRMLRETAEKRHGVPIKHAMISTMNLVAMYQEELDDALSYMGIVPVFRPFNFANDPVYESVATNLGYGFELCPDYKDIIACEHWERVQDNKTQADPDNVYIISYSRNALATAEPVMNGMYELYQPRSQHVEDFSLGSESMYDIGGDERYYWNAVRYEMVQLARTSELPAPKRIMFSGEDAQTEKFMINAAKALDSMSKERWDGQIPPLFLHDPTFVAARGTAELAKRLLYKAKWR